MEFKLLSIPYKVLQDLALLTSPASSQAPPIAGDNSMAVNIFKPLECTRLILLSRSLHIVPLAWSTLLSDLLTHALRQSTQQ